MRQRRSILALATAVAALLTAFAAWERVLEGQPPPASAANLRAAAEALASAERTVGRHFEESARQSAEGVHHGFEAIRSWMSSNPAGEAMTLERVLAAFESGNTVAGESGPYADALNRAVRETARRAAETTTAVPLDRGLADLERTMAEAVGRAAREFMTANSGLVQSVRWEVIFEAFDTGFVPTDTIGPVATAFLRNLGIPAPGTAAQRISAGLLAAQTGIAPAEALSTASGGARGAARPGEDPFNQITALDLDAPGSGPQAAGTLPATAFVTVPLGTKESAAPPPARQSKIHPVLEQMLRDRPGTERVQVLVNLRDEFQMPRFPERATEPAGALVAMAGTPPPMAGGTARAAAPEGAHGVPPAAAALVAQIEARRRVVYERLRTAWASAYSVEVLQTYWLVQAMLVEMPLSRVGALSEQAEVLYIEPRFTRERPPQDANASNDVEDGRARIASDPYFNAIASSIEFIGLLDTGVRFSHQLFGPRILLREDCTGADGACDGAPNPVDDTWNHGTSSAGILIGNNSMGGAFRGATGFYLDSFKIYDATGLDTAATVLAFQRAVATLNRVLVGEIQGAETDTGTIATAADNAFDSGAMVIAANGNFGPGASSVRSPGIAHKVIGIGSIDVQSAAIVASSGRGPAPDGRIKPDLQAPTNTETASNAADNALQVFTGTSGATPYGSSAAALARKWMRGSASIDPGKVYAFLILAGQQPYPFNNDSGAGLLVLPNSGRAAWGKVSVANGESVEIPIVVDANRQQLDGAIWWPEGAAETHDDVDLWLVDPSGAVRFRSVSIPSVFEKVRQRVSPLATGTWKLQIRGFRVTSGPQEVYWATHVKR